MPAVLTKTTPRGVRYRSAGEGEDALLVLPGSIGGADGIATFFARDVLNQRTLVPEYAPVPSVGDYLEAFEEILDVEKIQRAACYGGSFGGLLAQCWVRKHPERVTNLILGGAAIPDPTRVQKHLRYLKMVPFFPMPVMRFMLRLLLKTMTRKMKSNRELWSSEFSHLIAGMSKDDFASRYKVAADFDGNYRFAASNLVSFPGRILLLEGELDKVSNAETRAALRSLYPQAQTHLFRNAGHSMMLTHSEEWASVVRDFLKRTDT